MQQSSVRIAIARAALMFCPKCLKDGKYVPVIHSHKLVYKCTECETHYRGTNFTKRLLATLSASLMFAFPTYFINEFAGNPLQHLIIQKGLQILAFIVTGNLLALYFFNKLYLFPAEFEEINETDKKAS